MSLAVVYSRATIGINAPLVTVETHISKGLPGFSIVGLAETAVKESKDRVRSALLNSGFELPKGRITVNLAPADLPKEGGRFDLPIALSILGASKQISPFALKDYEFSGELGLTGELRAIPGILPIALATQTTNRALVIPEDNMTEAQLLRNLTIYPAPTLLSVASHLSQATLLDRLEYASPSTSETNFNLNLADVKGQHLAKRALELAAAGGHSLLMIGPPGCGKTMLASRLPSILPPLTEKEAIEVAAIQCLQDNSQLKNFGIRPFRSPHHSASSVALVGGGRHPKPGEISLAHCGVLFLDELPEYERRVLEALREPLESGKVHISRAMQQVEFPANFQLIAAMNPCPCGHLGDNYKSCRCTPEQISRYHTKLSGPFLDRIDINLQVPNLPPHLLSTRDETTSESSEEIQERVLVARARQIDRQGKINSKLSAKEINQHCKLPEETQSWLTQTMDKLKISARAYHRLLKVARTIADIEGNKIIEKIQLSEALSYRQAPLSYNNQKELEQSLW